MKISNNALNFLLAQYRAIFKRAYVKGIASAVLLTAGLAAGQAQAATGLDITNFQLPQSGQTAAITGDAAATGDYSNGNAKFTNIAISSGSGDIWNGDVTIESGTAGNQNGNNYIVSESEINITGDGSLTIDIQDEDAVSTQGLLIAGYGQKLDLDIGTISVLNGTLNINDAGSDSASGTVTVEANTIAIGGNSTDGTTAFLNLTGADKGTTLGRKADNKQSGSEISVLEGGLLNMKGSGASGTTILPDFDGKM